MKKLFLISIALFIASAVFFLACDKSEINEPKTFNDGTELALNILDFKAKMLSKSNDLMPLEEALDNMELLINASHGFPFEEYGQRKHDVVSFQLQADENGNVSMAEIAAAYDEMINLVRDTSVNTDFDEKGLVVVTLNVNESDKSGNTIDVDVTTGQINEPGTDVFTDCWYYGELLGMCDETWAFEKDGGIAIAEEILENNPINDYNDCPGPDYHIITENQDVIELEGNEPICYNDQNEPLVFLYPDDGSGFSNDEKQLSPDDMNYYYNGEYQVLFNNIPNSEVYGNYIFPDYVLVGCEIIGEPAYVGGIWSLHHENQLLYARRYWVHNGTIPKPTPID